MSRLSLILCALHDIAASENVSAALGDDLGDDSCTEAHWDEKEVGTPPACGGEPDDCKDGWKYDRDHDKGSHCWTGHKVVCHKCVPCMNRPTFAYWKLVMSGPKGLKYEVTEGMKWGEEHTHTSSWGFDLSAKLEAGVEVEGAGKVMETLSAGLSHQVVDTDKEWWEKNKEEKVSKMFDHQGDVFQWTYKIDDGCGHYEAKTNLYTETRKGTPCCVPGQFDFDLDIHDDDQHPERVGCLAGSPVIGDKDMCKTIITTTEEVTTTEEPTTTTTTLDDRVECNGVEFPRRDCGFSGIDKDECELRGCCYAEVADSPWCFYSKITNGTTTLPPQEPTTPSSLPTTTMPLEPTTSVPVDPSESTTSAPATTPPPSICPGGSLVACVDSCPVDDMSFYKDCVSSCHRRCPVDPVDPTDEPTVAPVDPTQEPTSAPEEPTTAPAMLCPGGSLDACIDLCPIEDLTIYKSCMSSCQRRCPEKPTTVAPTTAAPLDPTTGVPTTAAPVDPTTQAPTTAAPVDPTTQKPTPLPADKCQTCMMTCAVCKECTDGPNGSFTLGSCEKCWQCWNVEDDKLEDDDDKECHALNKDHDWDDEEVQCLSNDYQDCRACWAELGDAEVFV